MLQHPSDWTKRRATQTKQSEAKHIGSVRVEEVNLLLHLFIYSGTLYSYGNSLFALHPHIVTADYSVY